MVVLVVLCLQALWATRYFWCNPDGSVCSNYLFNLIFNGFLTNFVAEWATQSHSTKLWHVNRAVLLNFGFSQIVCSSSCERGRSSSHSSTSTTTPPCESTFLYPTGSASDKKPPRKKSLLRFPLWWIGAKYVAGGSSFLVTSPPCHDH